MLSGISYKKLHCAVGMPHSAINIAHDEKTILMTLQRTSVSFGCTSHVTFVMPRLGMLGSALAVRLTRLDMLRLGMAESKSQGLSELLELFE